VVVEWSDSFRFLRARFFIESSLEDPPERLLNFGGSAFAEKDAEGAAS
jgi:hypothetical protein